MRGRTWNTGLVVYGVTACVLTACGVNPPDELVPESASPVYRDEGIPQSAELPVPRETFVSPSWNDEAQTTCLSHARDTMTAFLDTSNTEAWYANLEPLLTKQCATIHEVTDPTTIPHATVMDEGITIVSPLDEEHLYSCVVQVPTDIGVFGVLLVRESANDWESSRIGFPGDTFPEMK